jgi:small GTP-binding protein
MDDYKVLYKYVIIGDSSVGKTSIIKRYTHNTFEENHRSTIGIDFIIKNIDIDNKRIKLQIWDTAGQERFKHITTMYYKSAHAFIIVYDVTKVDSFNNITNWIAEINNKKSETFIPAVSILVGNKIDSENREISYEEGASLAQQYGMLFIEVSAKEDTNVESLFRILTRNVVDLKSSSGPIIVPESDISSSFMLHEKGRYINTDVIMKDLTNKYHDAKDKWHLYGSSYCSIL